MSADVFREVTSQSWFGRIGGAFKGIVVGLILIVGSGALLFWNEGRAVKRYKTLKEGGGAVMSVSAEVPDSGNEGRLVHVAGKAVTEETLSDPEFGVSARAIRLLRNVEMFQWSQESRSETRKKLGGGTETVTTYTYSKVWDDDLVNSSTFKEPSGHQNPSEMPYRSKSFPASRVTLGGFLLSPSQVSRIGGAEPLNAGMETLPDHLRNGTVSYGGGYYLGWNPSQPEVGDLRVTFKVVRPTDVSVVARQTGSGFEPYRTKAGGSIDLLETGFKSAEAMFQQAQQENTVVTWVVRLVGFLLMACGFGMVLKPLSVLADVVPFVGNLVGAGTGLVSMILGAVFSLIAIAMGWIVYRPLLGVGLLVVAAALVFLVRSRMRKATVAAPAPPPPPMTSPPPPPRTS